MGRAGTGRTKSLEDRMQPGDPAPDFTLPATTGQTVSLADCLGDRRLVLFFMREFT